MEIEDIQWRANARVVSYVDLVISSVEVLLLIGESKDTEMLTSRDDGCPEIGIEEVVYFWVIVVVLAPQALLHLWAAVQLMKATFIETEHMQSLNLGSTWRNITVFYLIIRIIRDIVEGYYILLAISMISRGIFLFVVNNFIDELEKKVYGTVTVTEILSELF